jgi:GNAT superfamily N-acetyltransferase
MKNIVNNLSFVPTTLADADALVDIRIEAMRESLERVGRFDAVRARERFLSSFQPLDTRFILLNDEVAGFVVIKTEGDFLILDHLYIRLIFQRKGIGAFVLQELFAHAVVENKPVRVGALKGSESNQFYSRHGFKLVEAAEFDNYYVWSHDLS